MYIHLFLQIEETRQIHFANTVNDIWGWCSNDAWGRSSGERTLRVRQSMVRHRGRGELSQLEFEGAVALSQAKLGTL